MSPTDVSAAVHQFRNLATFDLEHPRYDGAPTFPAHTPGFHYTLHRRHEPGLEDRTSASGLIVTAEHNGTHIDALCHQAEGLQLFGGCDIDTHVQTPTGFTQLGAETIPPIIARGLLLDVATSLGTDRLEEEYLVTAGELERTATTAGVSISEGDVVLVRTGNARTWKVPEVYLHGPGIGVDAAQWLAEHRPLAVGADNVAFDVVGHVDPVSGSLPCHRVLIPRHGIYILENLNLEQLAASGITEFVFLCLPMKMQGVTGSPVRPLALAPIGGHHQDLNTAAPGESA